MRRVVLSLVLTVYCAAWASRLSAQSTYSAILGTVTDATGSSVANATVVITNTDENTTRELRTNDNGDYDGEILPGRYRVIVTNTWFSSYNATNLSLIARQPLPVDAVLQIGQPQQSVTVNDAEALSQPILRSLR